MATKDIKTEQDNQVQDSKSEVVDTPQTEVVEKAQVEEKEPEISKTLFPIVPDLILRDVALTEIHRKHFLPADSQNMKGKDVSKLVEDNLSPAQQTLFNDIKMRGIQNPLTVMLSKDTKHIAMLVARGGVPLNVDGQDVAVVIVGGNTRYEMTGWLGTDTLPVKDAEIKNTFDFLFKASGDNIRDEASPKEKAKAIRQMISIMAEELGENPAFMNTNELRKELGFAPAQWQTIVIPFLHPSLATVVDFITPTNLQTLLQAAADDYSTRNYPDKEIGVTTAKYRKIRDLAAKEIGELLNDSSILEALKSAFLKNNSRKSELPLPAFAVLTGLGDTVRGVSAAKAEQAAEKFVAWCEEHNYQPEEFEGYVKYQARISETVENSEEVEDTDTEKSDQSNDQGGGDVQSFDLGANSGAPTAGTSRKTTPNKVVVSNFLREIGISEEHVAVVSAFVASLYEPRGDAETALTAAFDASTSEALTNLLGAIDPANLNGKKAE